MHSAQSTASKGKYEGYQRAEPEKTVKQQKEDVSRSELDCQFVPYVFEHVWWAMINLIQYKH